MVKDEEILQVLKEIKTLLEPKPAPPPPPPPKGLWKEFIDFISKYKVVGLPWPLLWASMLVKLSSRLLKTS